MRRMSVRLQRAPPAFFLPSQPRRGVGAWRYLEAAWERYEFLTRVVAKVVPGDSREKAVEEKDDALSHAARTQARRILASPIKTPLDLDARAWLVLLASDFTFSIEAMVKRRRAVRSAGASTVSALISQG